ncbi:hypothetical protein LZ30DRAFT_694949 [Colletotrichum cereale]|nr:hypothetical protein LZ30DRAFT_694949 [Colletotrichum cereale]
MDDWIGSTGRWAQIPTVGIYLGTLSKVPTCPLVLVLVPLAPGGGGGGRCCCYCSFRHTKKPDRAELLAIDKGTGSRPVSCDWQVRRRLPSPGSKYSTFDVAKVAREPLLLSEYGEITDTGRCPDTLRPQWVARGCTSRASVENQTMTMNINSQSTPTFPFALFPKPSQPIA